MKASDSTTSLDALNPPDPACFICLETEHPSEEPLVDSKLLRTCGCRFSVHPVCWNLWLQDKSDFDCPICHRESVRKIPISPHPMTPHVAVFEQESSRQTRRNKRRDAIIVMISLSLFIVFLLAMVSKI